MAKQKKRDQSFLHKRYHQPGTAPGTLVQRHPKQTNDPTITLIRYSERQYSEETVNSIEECWSPATDQITWINITGYHDPALLQQLGEHYHIHPLALEDVVNAGQRPKWETNEGYDFLILRQVFDKEEVVVRQVSIFLGQDFLITLVESGDDGLALVRERLSQGSGSIRRRGSDYLCYTVCDALIDGFFPLLEQLGEQLDDLEEKLIGSPDLVVLTQIHHLKRELLVLARTIWAEREVVNCMLRGDSPLIQEDTLRYLRDCYDHTVQDIDVIEVYRDIATGMVEAYLSSVSNQMNSVMKVLTIIATVFIPLTFIVGVYGMNFKNMPELQWEQGYVVVWALMLLIAAGMVVFFRRKKWL